MLWAQSATKGYIRANCLFKPSYWLTCVCVCSYMHECIYACVRVWGYIYIYMHAALVQCCQHVWQFWRLWVRLRISLVSTPTVDTLWQINILCFNNCQRLVSDVLKLLSGYHSAFGVCVSTCITMAYHTQSTAHVRHAHNNNNGYFEHLTCTGPKRLHVL